MLQDRSPQALKAAILEAMPEDLNSILPVEFFTAWGQEPGWKETPRHHALHYRLCCAVTRVLQPRSVLEIGVRLGYSLGALLAGCKGPVHAVGWDTEAYVPGCLEIARKNLGRVGFGARLEKRDSQAEVEFPEVFDLVHVDGDHSYGGASQDVGNAINASKAVLVDDYHPKNHPGVWMAVREFRPGWAATWDLITFTDDDFPDNLPTKGLALLVRHP